MDLRAACWREKIFFVSRIQVRIVPLDSKRLHDYRNKITEVSYAESNNPVRLSKSDGLLLTALDSKSPCCSSGCFSLVGGRWQAKNYTY